METKEILMNFHLKECIYGLHWIYSLLRLIVTRGCAESFALFYACRSFASRAP